MKLGIGVERTQKAECKWKDWKPNLYLETEFKSKKAEFTGLLRINSSENAEFMNGRAEFTIKKTEFKVCFIL